MEEEEGGDGLWFYSTVSDFLTPISLLARFILSSPSNLRGTHVPGGGRMREANYTACKEEGDSRWVFCVYSIKEGAVPSQYIICSLETCPRKIVCTTSVDCVWIFMA